MIIDEKMNALKLKRESLVPNDDVDAETTRSTVITSSPSLCCDVIFYNIIGSGIGFVFFATFVLMLTEGHSTVSAPQEAMMLW